MSTVLGIEMKTTALPVIEDKDAQKVAGALSNVLADTFVLYLKTHNFHWNVSSRQRTSPGRRVALIAAAVTCLIGTGFTR